MLFDSHAHVTFPTYAPSEHLDVLQRAADAGIGYVMNIATDEKALEAGLALQTKELPVALFLAAATHPHDLTSADDPLFPRVASLASTGALAAVGETGLDYSHGMETKELQRMIFSRYAELSQETKKPLLIHCREAFDDLFSLFRGYGGDLFGVLHCFTGTEADAKRLLDLGWYISISGIVTFPKSAALKTLVKYLPLDRLLLETDAPYLAPQAKRGLRNEPAFLVYTAQVIAELKELSLEQLASATTHNALSLFGRGAGIKTYVRTNLKPR